jgi:hypothetical protein
LRHRAGLRQSLDRFGCCGGSGEIGRDLPQL